MFTFMTAPDCNFDGLSQYRRQVQLQRPPPRQPNRPKRRRFAEPAISLQEQKPLGKSDGRQQPD
jgi:hypothetical protein